MEVKEQENERTDDVMITNLSRDVENIEFKEIHRSENEDEDLLERYESFVEFEESIVPLKQMESDRNDTRHSPHSTIVNNSAQSGATLKIRTSRSGSMIQQQTSNPSRSQSGRLPPSGALSRLSQRIIEDEDEINSTTERILIGSESENVLATDRRAAHRRASTNSRSVLRSMRMDSDTVLQSSANSGAVNALQGVNFKGIQLPSGKSLLSTSSRATGSPPSEESAHDIFKSISPATSWLRAGNPSPSMSFTEYKEIHSINEFEITHVEFRKGKQKSPTLIKKFTNRIRAGKAAGGSSNRRNSATENFPND
uniref:Uncharacterized protein n=1 Tax=Timspurckia oligopyrenoides TaxID=708627 RepID=A0A7S0ZJB4_9RHOD|mmetsp:Transcript_7396/g.13350  ORF Transcript_7396/g.13350 Transcript_7396/m.13350 type:complete len:311 (+) Transcript_7396:168-1100(+)